MEQQSSIYEQLVKHQLEAQRLRPIYRNIEAAYDATLEAMEELMESDEAQQGLHEGSRTFEIFQAQGEPTVTKQVKAETFEEAFFKWMLISGYDNPFRQEALPHANGDTVDYEGIQATFYEQDTLYERIVQKIQEEQHADEETLRSMSIPELEAAYPDYKYIRLGIMREWYNDHRDEYESA